jgi:hypothetical protein
MAGCPTSLEISRKIRARQPDRCFRPAINLSYATIWRFRSHAFASGPNWHTPQDEKGGKDSAAAGRGSRRQRQQDFKQHESRHHQRHWR